MPTHRVADFWVCSLIGTNGSDRIGCIYLHMGVDRNPPSLRLCKGGLSDHWRIQKIRWRKFGASLAQGFFFLAQVLKTSQGITLYYGVWLCTTEYDFVLWSVTLYYGVWLCTTEYDWVLRSLTIYFGVWLCTTEYNFVLRSMTLYYRVWLCNTECDFVLRSMSLPYGVWNCITERVKTIVNL